MSYGRNDTGKESAQAILYLMIAQLCSFALSNFESTPLQVCSHFFLRDKKKGQVRSEIRSCPRFAMHTYNIIDEVSVLL